MKAKYIFSLFIVLMLASCTEKIDLDLATTNERLVIEGELTSDDTIQTIKLTKSTSYYYNEQPPSVQNAKVSIFDGTQNIEFKEIEPGIYASPNNFKGDTLKQYQLNIELNEPINNATSYQASSSMPSVIQQGSIDIVYHDDWLDGIWEVQLYAWDPPQDNFYLFRSFQNGVSVTDTITEWIVSEDRFYNGNFTNGAGVAYFNRKEGQVLHPGDTVTIQMSGITEEYFTFISQVKEAAFGQNPMFSGPPANVQGNIDKGGIGFFAVYSNVYFTTIYKGE